MLTVGNGGKAEASVGVDYSLNGAVGKGVLLRERPRRTGHWKCEAVGGGVDISFGRRVNRCLGPI
jgi:stress response protein SCP2